MSNFKTGDILKCVSNSGMPMLELGGMYKFIRYAHDCSHIVVLHDGAEQCYLISRFTKSTEEKKVDTIQLTYAEAWEALKEGKEVFYNGCVCRINSVNNTIIYKTITLAEFYAPFHLTDKLFTMKKEPEYEILGLHDDLVGVEVFGLKTYLEKNSYYIFYMDIIGIVFEEKYRTYIGRVKFKGDHTKAKVKVTVDKDGNVTYEYLS